MQALVKILAGWTALAVPTSLLIGRVARVADSVGGQRMTLQTTKADLDRLVEIELTEIPRLRSALSDWVDDPLLASTMHELETEAQGLRLRLGLERWPTTSVGVMSPAMT